MSLQRWTVLATLILAVSCFAREAAGQAEIQPPGFSGLSRTRTLQGTALNALAVGPAKPFFCPIWTTYSATPLTGTHTKGGGLTAGVVPCLGWYGF